MDTIGLVYLGLFQALVVVPMLVQSYLDAFLAAVVEVKDSLRASPRVLFHCCFFSRPTSRSSLAPVPLGSTFFPSDARGPPRSTFGCGHSTPSNRLSGPACLSFFKIYIYCGDRARSAYPSLCYISTSPHLCMIVSTSAVVCVVG